MRLIRIVHWCDSRLLLFLSFSYHYLCTFPMFRVELLMKGTLVHPPPDVQEPF